MNAAVVIVSLAAIIVISGLSVFVRSVYREQKKEREWRIRYIRRPEITEGGEQVDRK